MNVRQPVLILVKPDLSTFGVHHVIALPAVVGDAVSLFELIHGEYVGNPLRDIPRVGYPINAR
jgi:hypothetical protein